MNFEIRKKGLLMKKAVARSKKTNKDLFILSIYFIEEDYLEKVFVSEEIYNKHEVMNEYEFNIKGSEYNGRLYKQII